MIEPVSTNVLPDRQVTAAAGKQKDSPERIADAARQFEALLVGQILKSIRESEGSSWLGTGADQSGESAMAMAEEQFASAISKSGGLGLANTISASLARKP